MRARGHTEQVMLVMKYVLIVYACTSAGKKGGSLCSVARANGDGYMQVHGVSLVYAGSANFQPFLCLRKLEATREGQESGLYCLELNQSEMKAWLDL